jgi:hypothetical protein
LKGWLSGHERSGGEQQRRTAEQQWQSFKMWLSKSLQNVAVQNGVPLLCAQSARGTPQTPAPDRFARPLRRLADQHNADPKLRKIIGEIVHRYPNGEILGNLRDLRLCSNLNRSILRGVDMIDGPSRRRTQASDWKVLACSSGCVFVLQRGCRTLRIARGPRGNLLYRTVCHHDAGL